MCRVSSVWRCEFCSETCWVFSLCTERCLRHSNRNQVTYRSRWVGPINFRQSWIAFSFANTIGTRGPLLHVMSTEIVAQFCTTLPCHEGNEALKKEASFMFPVKILCLLNLPSRYPPTIHHLEVVCSYHFHQRPQRRRVVTFLNFIQNRLISQSGMLQ